VNYIVYRYLYTMLCIHSESSDPYYNLAAEEYLLKQSTEAVFMVWQSTPAVVVGKHQNALAEINYRFVRDRGILVARRLSGGGAVYHDDGNINFSFILQGEPGKLVNFAGFIEIVTRFLKTYDIEAHQGLKNEILVNDKKISGNAEHVNKNRVLHHGTLLVNADLNILRESIRQGNGKYTDKAVQSNRSSVMNLAECLNPAITMADFQAALLDFVMQHYHGRLYELEEYQKMAIRQLAAEKYNTWAWIYGWSPDYEFENLWRTNMHEIVIQLSTHRGIITRCNIKSPVIASELTAMISDQLLGKDHEEGNIRKTLEASELRLILDNRDIEDLVLAFF
jgi:lipoate-protein ligase A